MNINILKWYFIALVIVILPFYLIPETSYDSLGWSIGIVTSLLACFFIFLGISKIESINDLFYFDSDNPRSNNPLVVIIPIALFIFGSIMINTNFGDRLDEKIKKEGVFAKATIDSGFSEITQSSRSTTTSNTLALTLVTDDNVEHKLIAENVSSDAYRKVGVGLSVEIIYLPSDPKIFRVLVDDEAVKKFKNIANRQLDFKDLEKIITITEPAKLEKLLNKVSSGWEAQTTEQPGFGFINNLKKEAIFVSAANRTLLYIHDKDYTSKGFEVPKERILRELSDSASVSYELDKYFIEKNSKTSVDQENSMTLTTVENIIIRTKQL